MTISTSEKMGLVDTNILVYTFNAKHFQLYQEIEVITLE